MTHTELLRRQAQLQVLAEQAETHEQAQRVLDEVHAVETALALLRAF